jgi:hypothetical protein
MKNDIPLNAIRGLVDYLEYDERRDYEGYCDDDGKVVDAEGAKNHIYRHVRRVSNWLEKL